MVWMAAVAVVGPWPRDREHHRALDRLSKYEACECSSLCRLIKKKIGS